jgi:urease accessory protein
MKLNTPVYSDPDLERPMKIRHFLTPALITLLPALAFAHPGHELQPGIAAGVMHPFSGLDHLAAMLAVGMWAAQLGGRMRWAVPASFVSLMLAGALLGLSGLQIGAVEQGIAASVCVLGLLLAGAVRLPAMACVLLAGLFAVFHGYAHAAEAPVSGVGRYMVGFAFSTAVLHVVGLMVAGQLVRYQQQHAMRWTGAAMVVGSLALFAV